MSLRIPVDPLTAFGHADKRRVMSSRAFSLVDLLVAIGVMSVLIALLMPSLASATEQARRVRCSTQMRQVGIALQMYSFDQKDELPASVYEAGASNQPHEMIALRLGGTADQPGNWDGLGVLFEQAYLSHPQAMYCPSHHGAHDFSVYSSAWAGQSHAAIFGNFHYRVPANRALSELSSYATLVADGMRRRSDYNHLSGNNYLKADLSVGWYNDRQSRISNLLVNDGVGSNVANAAVFECWRWLDTIAPGSDTAFDPTTMPSNQIPMMRGNMRPDGSTSPGN